MSSKTPTIQGWQDQSHPHPTLCALHTQLEPQHPQGMMDMKRASGKCSQREDELLAWVSQRQNLLLFTSGQENTQQVEKPITHRLSGWAWSKKGPEYFTQAPRGNHWNKTVSPPSPGGQGRAGNTLHGMGTAAQTPILDGMCS